MCMIETRERETVNEFIFGNYRWSFDDGTAAYMFLYSFDIDLNKKNSIKLHLFCSFAENRQVKHEAITIAHIVHIATIFTHYEICVY